MGIADNLFGCKQIPCSSGRVVGNTFLVQETRQISTAEVVSFHSLSVANPTSSCCAPEPPCSTLQEATTRETWAGHLSHQRSMCYRRSFATKFECNWVWDLSETSSFLKGSFTCLWYCVWLSVSSARLCLVVELTFVNWPLKIANKPLSPVRHTIRPRTDKVQLSLCGVRFWIQIQFWTLFANNNLFTKSQSVTFRFPCKPVSNRVIFFVFEWSFFSVID